MRHYFFCGAVLAVTIGCGGGAPPAIVDTTPPELVGTTPAEGASVVRVSEPIVVRFSEPIQPGFTVKLHAGDAEVALPAEAVATADYAQEVRITPPRTLDLPQVMRLVITGVADRFGNAIAGDVDVDLHFTYPAWIEMVGGGECGPSAGLFATAGSALFAAIDDCACRWTGSSWELLPGPAIGGDAPSNHYAADPVGGLALCSYPWGGGTPTVKRFAAGEWTTLPSLPITSVLDCGLSFVGDVPYAAVSYASGDQQAHSVFRLVTGGWQAVGNVVLAASSQEVSVHGDERAGLTMRAGSDLFALSPSGTEWEPLPNPGIWFDFGQGDAGPIVCGDGLLVQYTGGTWNGLGVTSDCAGLFVAPGVRPLLVQRDGYYAAALAWDGVAWRSLGPVFGVGPYVFFVIGDSGGRVFARSGVNVFEYNR